MSKHQTFALAVAPSLGVPTVHDSEPIEVRTGSVQFCVYVNVNNTIDVEIFRVAYDGTLRSQMEGTPETITSASQGKFVFYESVSAIVVRITNNSTTLAVAGSLEMVDGGVA